MRQQIRIGTRASLLAAAQAELLKQHIESRRPDIGVSIVKIKTAGDKILDRKLDEIGGKGLFVRELDLALRAGDVDLTVHSLKDVPMEEDPAYPILGYSKREDPRDALILPQGCARLDPGRPIGTSSPRRSLQLAALYPGCRVEFIRGNIMTRLQKLDGGGYGALVLAAAGIRRLGLEQRISRFFSTEEMVPAAGQGILAVQGRRDFAVSLLEGFFDENAKWQALAERSFVRALGGGCSSPAAAYAAVWRGVLSLTGLVDTQKKPCGFAAGTLKAPAADAVQLGVRLAQKLLEER